MALRLDHFQRHKLELIGAVATYAGLVWVLNASGYLQVSNGALGILLGSWVGGFVLGMFMMPAIERHEIDANGLMIGLAVWGNVGVVVIANLAAGEIRLLLLVAVAFGIFYAATRLTRGYVVKLGLLAAIAYLVVHVILQRSVSDFELLALVSFALIVSAAVWIGLEVSKLREGFDRRNAALNEVVRRDDLTGLFNRREFFAYAAHQRALAQRGKLSFALCFLDLDHFKRVNDRFGHRCGDEVLVRFGQIAGEAVRDVDFVARVGGEEFILLLTDVSNRGAALVVERIREQTRSMRVDRRDTAFHITVSVGVAQFQIDDSIEELMNRADRALYLAKAAGRNRIEFAQNIPAAEPPRARSVNPRKSRAMTG
ncbi:MAG: GGDEF domain-containing protein [Gammaproteobacteria bacterium]|nr:GGDEF domain-containing protein [Gammaproteobacteria bacterium]